jgi:hypothetical protein
MSAVTLSFQIISAKLVAQNSANADKSAVYRLFHQGAWACGISIGLLLLLFQRSISDYLHLPSPALVALLAVGATFYVPLGARRGYVQGAYGFGNLARNLVLEGAVRLGGSLLMVMTGFGVAGVVAANSAAIAVAYLAIVPKLEDRSTSPVRSRAAVREILHAMVFFSGQVVINNCDIVLVKHFFAPKPAGVYAAIAMVGRVMFAFSSAVVNSMFPLVAGTSEDERKSLEVIGISLLLVLGIGSVMALGLGLAPPGIWTMFFGPGFALAGKHGLSYLMALYAITTVIYSLSVVIITYEMSYKIANTSWVQLALGMVVIGGIWEFHSSLKEVIVVQLILMVVLLALVAVPFLLNSLTNPKTMAATGAYRSIRIVKPVSEDEVIAEFLKSDFNKPIYREYHHSLREIVAAPDLNEPTANAKRRALLNVRHLALWAELPEGTKWYEVEVLEDDLERIRVFPRAQWRKLAQGNFSITTVAERMLTQEDGMERHFSAKINAIRNLLLQEDSGLGPVILIGRNEDEHFTILDGNHRAVAAILASPSCLHKVRFLCGLSPRMNECCWYDTNFTTLVRYGRNVLTHMTRNPKAALARLLQGAG